MKPVRVLIAKPGLDGHDRGAHLVAITLRDAGMEVIYTGLHQTTQAIVEAAIQEDVDVIGLSILSGAHISLVKKFMSDVHNAKIEDKVIIVGGTITEGDAAILRDMGVDAVYPVGTKLSILPEEVQALVNKKQVHTYE